MFLSARLEIMNLFGQFRLLPKKLQESVISKDQKSVRDKISFLFVGSFYSFSLGKTELRTTTTRSLDFRLILLFG